MDAVSQFADAIRAAGLAPPRAMVADGNGAGDVFAAHAGEYARHGLRAFPVGGPDGKRPLVRSWQKAGSDSWRRWRELRRFANANIGIVDGTPGGISRVDVDSPEPSVLADAIRRFGDSPVKVSTPSGGTHLWFRFNGERRTLRLDGTPVDILGLGGYGVAPPSLRPGGGAYRFLEGGLADLDRLPRIKAGALPTPANDAPDMPVAPPPSRMAKPWREMGDHDGRNTTLFCRTLRLLKEIPTVDGAIEAALRENGRFGVPLDVNEAMRAINGAVRKHAAGDNWVGQGARLMLTTATLESFSGDSDALMLDCVIRSRHAGRPEPFVLVAKAMARDNVIPGWTPRRYKIATGQLVVRGRIRRIHTGGRRKGDPHLYVLGGENRPQYNTTPPPSAPPLPGDRMAP